MSAAVKHVLIGGGTGFVGRHLSNALRDKGHKVTIVSRMPGPQRISWLWSLQNEFLQLPQSRSLCFQFYNLRSVKILADKMDELAISGLPPQTSAIVSLAGQNVLDPKKRWTPGFKQNIWASRVSTTTALAEASLNSQHKPEVFVSISGVGVYSPSPVEEYNEESKVKEFDFLSGLCLAWECAANRTLEGSIRPVIVRSGVVLGKDGGMIKQMWLPFFLGLGGPIGTGSQYLPWIHIDDLVSLIIFAIENQRVRGVLNGVAPQVITNKDFTLALAKAMSRPALFQVPTFLLKLAFNEERAKMMTEGQKVIPKRTLECGFQFKYENINEAVQQIVGNSK